MKKLFLLLIAVFALSVSAFAADSHFTDSLHIEYGTAGVLDCTVTSGEGSFCLVSSSSNTAYDIWFVSLQNNATCSISGTKQNGDPYSVNLTSSAVLYNGNSSVYYYNYNTQPRPANTVFSPDMSLYPYDVQHSIVANDYQSFLDNPDVGVQSSFRVPAGNVLYFQVDREQDVTLDANMPKLSSFLFGGSSSPWGDSGIMYGPAAALPSSSTTFPISSQDSVRWSVKPPSNVFGQSRVGTASKRCIIGQWYALYLPSIFGLKDSTSDLDSSRYLPGASVDISGSFSQIKVFPLESQYDWSDADFVTGSTDDYASYYDGTVDENGTVTFTNQDGDVATPPNGGSNQFDVDTNPLNLVETIKNLLSNILKEIESLFTFGYSAISSLAGLMQDFVSVLGQLYTWLPDPVYSALISAIVISIVIGVFKVFL